MLGDDIVIASTILANLYKQMLSRLGVETSNPKTHISKHMYEFAKRWHWRGQEISGIPINGFLASERRW
jgi:hypothetical protein